MTENNHNNQNITTNKKPKMKWWKKILIGIGIFLGIFILIAEAASSSDSKEELNKITEENKALKQENEDLKKQVDDLLKTAENSNKVNETQKENEVSETEMEVSKETVKEKQKPSTTSSTNTKDIPREYKNALKSAENYIAFSPFSKKGLFQQLTSEHGSKFSKEAAQYAIDNLDVDYKEQALKSAKNYLDFMPMSDGELYDQLTSEHGEQYTAEEAQYAIDNLD